MLARRRFLQFAAVLPGAVGLAAGLRSDTASACSCGGYSRSVVLPAPGTTKVHRRTAIVFEVGGYEAPRVAAQERFEYWLEDAEGTRIELERDVLGNLVRLVPVTTLEPDTRYALHAELAPGARGSRWSMAENPLTKFRTGTETALPDIPEPRLRRVKRRTPKLSTPWCAGRSYVAEFMVEPPDIPLSAAGLFHWEVSYWDRRENDWVRFQGTPTYTGWYTDEPEPNPSLTVGNHQCNNGPVFPFRARKIRLALVRVDGERKVIERRFR